MLAAKPKIAGDKLLIEDLSFSLPPGGIVGQRRRDRTSLKHIETQRGVADRAGDEHAVARLRARAHTREHGTDTDEVNGWVWSDAGDTATTTGGPQADDTGADNV